MSSTAPHILHFSSPVELRPGERGVRLRFSLGFAGGTSSPTTTRTPPSAPPTSTPPPPPQQQQPQQKQKLAQPAPARVVELYAHEFMLRSCSRVMAGMLEDCVDGGGKKHDASTSDDPYINIPLDIAEAPAWDDALGIMYSVAHGRVFEVTWDNAERLLRLADKYDVPGVASFVATFLRGADTGKGLRLPAQLSKDNMWTWLTLCSKNGLNDLVDVCSDFAVNNSVSVTLAQLQTLSAAHADRHLAALVSSRSPYYRGY